jgi:hypothetical protein
VAAATTVRTPGAYGRLGAISRSVIVNRTSVSSTTVCVLSVVTPVTVTVAE